MPMTMLPRRSDRELAAWIADMYAVQLVDVARYKGYQARVPEKSARQITSRLVQMELLERRVFEWGRGPWYWCTQLGLDWCGAEYSPDWHPKPAQLAHLRATNDVYHWFSKHHAGAVWVGERAIRLKRARAARENGQLGPNQGHVPDAEVFFGDTCWAVEVERTRKGSRRLGKVLQSLWEDGYTHIWYFVTPKLQRKMAGLQAEWLERREKLYRLLPEEKRSNYGFNLSVLCYGEDGSLEVLENA